MGLSLNVIMFIDPIKFVTKHIDLITTVVYALSLIYVTLL